jgi:ATP-dependent DNA ligase
LVLRWPVEPMRAVGVAELPDLVRDGAVAEPKWDGFRALAWRSRDGVDLYSRHGRSLTRFFPDICQIFAASLPAEVVVDGELIIWETGSGRTSFVDLQRRLRAGRRINREAAARPAHLVCFDLLQDAGGKELLDRPLSHRRQRLERLLASAPPQLVLCPQTDDEHQARSWFADWATTGVEGLVVKRLGDRYRPGGNGWKKVKHRRTVEMVIGGVTGSASRPVALLLGRYDHSGRLCLLAQTHPLTSAQRHELAELLRPMPFQGNDAGHPWPSPLPANWSLNLTDRQPVPYVQVEPSVVAEIEVDVATGPGGRPRHYARHLRTRAELLPEHLPPWRAQGPERDR